MTEPIFPLATKGCGADQVALLRIAKSDALLASRRGFYRGAYPVYACGERIDAVMRDVMASDSGIFNTPVPFRCWHFDDMHAALRFFQSIQAKPAISCWVLGYAAPVISGAITSPVELPLAA